MFELRKSQKAERKRRDGSHRVEEDSFDSGFSFINEQRSAMDGTKKRRALNSIHLWLDKDELGVLFQLMEKEEKDAQIIRKLQLYMMKEWPCEDEDPSDEEEGGRWSDFQKKGTDSEEWGKFVGACAESIEVGSTFKI